MGLKVRFLGTGGGRYVTAYQLRRTGGFLIEDRGLLVHIDPGPGAVRSLKDFGIDVRKIDVLFVSHNHPDHVTDAAVVLEGMTEGTRKKRGTFIGSRSVFEGLDDYKVVSSYHLRLVEKHVVAEEGVQVELGEAGLEFFGVKHTDPTAVGFLWRGSKEVTFITDTGYRRGIERFVGDVLVVNLEVMKEVPSHTSPEVVRRILEGSSPKVVLLTHFGMSVLRYGPERIARELEREFGTEVIAATDGYMWEVAGEKSLFEF